MTSCNWRPGPLKSPIENITELEFPWHDWKEELETFNFDWVPEKFPNLHKLSIVTCSCWVNQDIPTKVGRLSLSLPNFQLISLVQRTNS